VRAWAAIVALSAVIWTGQFGLDIERMAVRRSAPWIVNADKSSAQLRAPLQVWFEDIPIVGNRPDVDVPFASPRSSDLVNCNSNLLPHRNARTQIGAFTIIQHDEVLSGSALGYKLQTRKGPKFQSIGLSSISPVDKEQNCIHLQFTFSALPADAGLKAAITYVSPQLDCDCPLSMREEFVALTDRVLSRLGASLRGGDGVASLSDRPDQGDDLANQSQELKTSDKEREARITGRLLSGDSLATFGIACVGMALNAAGWWLALAKLSGERRRGYVAGLSLWLCGALILSADLWSAISRAA